MSKKKQKAKKSKKKKYAKIPSSLKSPDNSKQKEKEKNIFPKTLPSPYQSERMHRAIGRLMDQHDFKSSKEAEQFVQNQIMGKSVEEVQALTDFEPSEEAQELAYKAMDTENPDEALELADRALQLDPDCIDALMIKVEFTARSIPDVIDSLKKIIARAEQKLGRQYFEENKGHFWGLVETRPYMRAQEFLTTSLKVAGQLKEAIKQAEQMLELNPNDNQGIRDSLLGMYLETGNLKGARKLIKKYPNQIMATFLWGQVLERYLSGKLGQAAGLYREANSKNPHVFDYLIGRKKYPLKYKQYYYTPGEESEAIQCAEEIGPAWQKHPEAIKWLMSLR
ncbi:MAG: tetratricopeptide repeat protein [Candidatus Aminicenantes bacterium]|nr:tetratricopeptide repeat protein [Candidatus Aminicenantes bacterium]